MNNSDSFDPGRRVAGVYPTTWEPPLAIYGLFLLFVLARYMQWGDRREIFATVRLEFTLGIALAIVCMLVLQTHPVQLKRGQLLVAALGLLFVVLTLSFPLAKDPDIAQAAYTEGVIKHSFLTFFMFALIRTPRQMWLFIATWLLACFYVYQESVQGLISGGLIWYNQGIPRLHGAVRIYHHPNSLGGFAVDAIPFVVYLFVPVRNKLIRLWFVGILATAVVCLVYTGSRSAYLAVLVFLIYVWSMSKQKRKIALAALVLVPVVMTYAPEDYIERFKSIGGEEAAGHSKHARISLAEDAWQIFKLNPLGVGLESFPKVRMDMFGKGQNTHNLYLEIAVTTGIQGVLVFGFFLYALFFSFNSALRSYRAQLYEINQVLKVVPALKRSQRFRTHYRDLELFVGLANAARGFVFCHIMLGFFGHDLLYIYWWFASGLALCMLRLVDLTSSRNRVFREWATLQASGERVAGELV